MIDIINIKNYVLEKSNNLVDRKIQLNDDIIVNKKYIEETNAKQEQELESELFTLDGLHSFSFFIHYSFNNEKLVGYKLNFNDETSITVSDYEWKINSHNIFNQIFNSIIIQLITCYKKNRLIFYNVHTEEKLKQILKKHLLEKIGIFPKLNFFLHEKHN